MERKKLHNNNNQLTFSVQHLGDIQVFLSHLEGVVQIGHRVVLNQSQYHYLSKPTASRQLLQRFGECM